MLKRVVVLVLAVMLTLAGATGVQARESTCLNGYFLCINDASQEEGAFWRTLAEMECGVEYYGCMRRLASGG